MLDFTTQKKLIQPILKKPQNHHCADCDSIAPTWASLDFGVFLCSDCSGAHRGLGPTITRVRSTNLDKWQQQWLQNMRIGNTLINTFWQADSMAANKYLSSDHRKPRAGASLKEISRYVFQKYIKRKWVSNSDEPDPLTRYKNGQFDISNQSQKKEPQPISKPSKPIQKPAQIIVKKQEPAKRSKNDVCLLDFDMEPPKNQKAPEVTANHNQSVQPVTNMIEEDDFSEYTQASNTVQENKATNQTFVSFDALLNQQKQQAPQPAVPSQMPMYQNMQLHHPYNPHIAQNNLVYQGQYQHQNHMPHQRTYSSVPHGYQGMNYQNPGGVSVMPPQNNYW